MNLIVTVDNRFGTGFNHRRQSRDQTVVEDILDLTDGKVEMDSYSRELFPETQAGNWRFQEREVDENLLLEAETLVLYHWHRDYPADCWLKWHPEDWYLIETKEWEGTSHERITREIYDKKA